jgi:hypothetical protein
MSDFVDALAAGRRPRGFRPGPEDAAVLRTAIELRAARPGQAAPDEEFVSRLFDELAEAVDHPASTRAALPLTPGQELRTGTFEDAANQNLGQIVVYGGNPSWVFMNVKGSSYDGPVTCRLQATNGSTVMTGSFDLHGGTGELAKTIRVNVGHLQGAQLVTSTGATLAAATFSYHD